jgi:hypothetical protein
MGRLSTFERWREILRTVTYSHNEQSRISSPDLSLGKVLRLNLIDGFRLTIRIAVRFARTIHTDNLLVINQRVKTVSKAFGEKNAEVNIEFEFKFHSQY